MPWSLNWRFWAGVFFLSLLPILYMKGRQDGRKLENLEHQAAIHQANAEARKMEQLRQARVVESQRAAAAREAAIRADADRARRAADGLRDTLDAVERASAQSADAARNSVAALSNVLEQCSRDYRALAEIADRHAADSLMLQQAWPK